MRRDCVMFVADDADAKLELERKGYQDMLTAEVSTKDMLMGYFRTS